MASEHTGIAILLAEDSSDDVELTRIELSKSSFVRQLDVVEHGGKVISFLSREGQFCGAARPDVILLDLHMPRMDGMETLNRIKNSLEWNSIPVLILTSLASPEQVEEALDSRADGYLTKPVTLEQLTPHFKKLDYPSASLRQDGGAANLLFVVHALM